MEIFSKLRDPLLEKVNPLRGTYCPSSDTRGGQETPDKAKYYSENKSLYDENGRLDTTA